jgi:dihydroorotase-like cyclic amidohydrolase
VPEKNLPSLWIPGDGTIDIVATDHARIRARKEIGWRDGWKAISERQTQFYVSMFRLRRSRARSRSNVDACSTRPAQIRAEKKGDAARPSRRSVLVDLDREYEIKDADVQLTG